MSDFLHHLESGAGSPLLIMHGGLGWDHTSLRPWLDPLARHARLTYYDHRGNGRSAEPEDWSEITHATWADDAEALRARLYGDRRMMLFGHSYGAVLALEYALRYPEHLDGLILCCAAPAFDHAEAAVERAYRRAENVEDPDATRRALDAALSAPPANDASFAALMRDLLPIYVHRQNSVDLNALHDGITFRASAVRRSFYELLPEFDVRDRLDEITSPVLVLSGRHDWIFPPEEGANRLAAGLPDAEHHVFEESGHLPFAEEPDSFVEIVSDWIIHVGAGRIMSE